MATKSFTTKQKFNKKTASKLLNAVEHAQGRVVYNCPPSNIQTIKIQDKKAMSSFINRTFISHGN